MDKAPKLSNIKVCVRDLEIFAHIGINPEEVGRRQPLNIGVELTIGAYISDEIDDTIDYRRISSAVEALAEVHISLIETFASRLGTECLSWSKVEEARITVDKPFALSRGVAGVQVIMRRVEMNDPSHHSASHLVRP